jgi:tetrahydromethanopterin S-methyltransferase subunit G
MSELNLLIDMIKELHKDLHEVDRKISDVKEEQVKQSFHIEKNTEDLKYHIKRTDMLEDDLHIFREDLDNRVDDLEDRVKTKKALKSIVVKSIGVTTGLIGLVLGLYKLIDIF